MRELETELEISAPDTIVWNILTDFDRYPDWNPFITEIEGRLQENARLQAFIRPPGSKGMTFKPTILRVASEREFRWRGRLLFPGLFDGEHIFLIEPINEAQVRFIQKEIFRGILVPLLWNSLNTSTRQGFMAMNQALKERAEQFSN
ncbi:MAG: SRPBCC domain-containing protein [Calditrichae bacterium]|nr:SRPBCC domain-containing protein [Calditrichia bacterium]NIW78184.1 SRPBCC domain-containing protein [Calditrichia bacterium]